MFFKNEEEYSELRLVRRLKLLYDMKRTKMKVYEEKIKDYEEEVNDILESLDGDQRDNTEEFHRRMKRLYTMQAEIRLLSEFREKELREMDIIIDCVEEEKFRSWRSHTWIGLLILAVSIFVSLLMITL